MDGGRAVFLYIHVYLIHLSWLSGWVLHFKFCIVGRAAESARDGFAHSEPQVLPGRFGCIQNLQWFLPQQTRTRGAEGRQK